MVNKVILLGNVGKDPEVRRMDNNLAVARFSLATSERWNKDGNWVEHTEWHNVVVWRWLAERVEKYVRKGTTVYVEGRIRSRSYDDKDGIKRYVTEILADVMNVLDKHEQTQQATPQQPVQQFTSEPPVITSDLDPGPQDDLPF